MIPMRSANGWWDRGGHYMGKSPGPPGLNAEDKYRDPDGVVFDLSEEGWVGTS